jgi:uncharacterized membrane protein
MNVPAMLKFISFFALIIVSFVLELLFIKVFFKVRNKRLKTKHFSFARYVYLLSMPFAIVVYFASGYDLNLAALFVGSVALGTFSEWMIGYFYHRIVGVRLWTYHEYSIGGYTSWLSAPLWGLAGLFFFLFLQVFV